MILDIGIETLNKWSEILLQHNTIVWNGPVGMFEKDQFGNGTKGIIENVFKKKSSITSIICGGDTGSAIKKYKGEKYVSHVSTGGGASLELLEGKELPGISTLTN